MTEIIISGSDITDKNQLHDIFAEKLGFPQWYGRNSDALHDCLTDVADEVKIVINDYEQLKETLGKTASVIKRVLIDSANENENIIVEVNR